MKRLLGTALAAATIAFLGAAMFMTPAAAASSPSKQGAATTQSGQVDATDMSAQRRYHRHRHFHGPRVYPRRYYPAYGYYRPRPYYYGPRYYAPRPYYGGPAFSFGFGPRYW